ncbi:MULTISPECIES: molybdopterin adenylyltransferase [Anaerolinea]|uniref:molybdopterin adenylyltransferase n=1 Tax=Anaerolinea TaxID=233189 RepID=UPI002625447A|nr:molybdopterin adenylyltransferase [Anaerolinea thermophila]
MSNPGIRVSILTISDRSFRGEREDLSGPALVKAIQQLGWNVVQTGLVPDEKEMISNWLIQACDSGKTDLVLTTGGTGFAPRDVTPEATRAILEREAPGIAEAMRQKSLQITPHAMLSRAIAGIRKRTLIINLPGSPKAAVENLQTVAAVIPHAVELLQESPDAEKGHTLSSS